MKRDGASRRMKGHERVEVVFPVVGGEEAVEPRRKQQTFSNPSFNSVT